jgi:hypothetical protein
MTVRVKILIDLSHIFMTLREMSARSGRGLRFSFRRLHEAIVAGREQGPYCRIYHSLPPEGRQGYLTTEDEAYFRGMGYAAIALPLRVRSIECFDCGRIIPMYGEKSVDAALITGIFTIALQVSKPDRIVVVSGDSDMLEAIRIVQGLGTDVEVWGFTDHTSKYIRTDGGLLAPTALDTFVLSP